jgi:hypothetical protein
MSGAQPHRLAVRLSKYDRLRLRIRCFIWCNTLHIWCIVGFSNFVATLSMCRVRCTLAGAHLYGRCSQVAEPCCTFAEPYLVLYPVPSGCRASLLQRLPHLFDQSHTYMAGAHTYMVGAAIATPFSSFPCMSWSRLLLSLRLGFLSLLIGYNAPYRIFFSVFIKLFST